MYYSDLSRYRRSHQRCFIKKDVLKNFEKFAGTYMYQSLFFNKITGLRPVGAVVLLSIS